MTKNEMPATEAGERTSYEIAFHVLPTVAEGEVPAVFEKLKTALTEAGVEISDEEAPQRFDLAYEIVKYLEGRNRKFSSAYFGWVRFHAQPEQLTAVEEVIEGTSELLRYLLIKLNRVEEANPFRFHEALATRKIETVSPADEDDEEGDDNNDDGEATEAKEVTPEDTEDEETK